VLTYFSPEIMVKNIITINKQYIINNYTIIIVSNKSMEINP